MNMENIVFFWCVAPLPAPHRPQLRAAHLVGLFRGLFRGLHSIELAVLVA